MWPTIYIYVFFLSNHIWMYNINPWSDTSIAERQTYADPWMLQCLASSDPLSRIHRQHLIDKILGFRCDGVPFWTRILSRTSVRTIFRNSSPRLQERKSDRNLSINFACSFFQQRFLSLFQYISHEIFKQCFNILEKFINRTIRTSYDPALICA